jgi:hypothetical protein
MSHSRVSEPNLDASSKLLQDRWITFLPTAVHQPLPWEKQLPRYFFHIRDDDNLIRDEEGTELPDLSAARKEAALSAREILVEAGSSSEPWDHCEIEIWEGAQLVEVVQLGLLVTERIKRTEH